MTVERVTRAVTEHADPQELWTVAEDLLLAREAAHTVMIGALSRLCALPAGQRGEPLLLSVARDGEVVAAALRTPPRALLLTSDCPPEALDALVDHLDRHDLEVPSVSGAVADAEAFARRWVERRGGEARPAIRLRLHGCPAVVPPRPVPGGLRDATGADRDLLVAWIDAFTAEALPHERPGAGAAELVDALLAADPPRLVVWEDGAPVSLAGFTVPERGSPRIGTVYTPSDVRGHGYASACVGALTRRLLDASHERVLLFTDLANPTSNRIYARLGYRPLGEFVELELGARRPG